ASSEGTDQASLPRNTTFTHAPPEGSGAVPAPPAPPAFQLALADGRPGLAALRVAQPIDEQLPVDVVGLVLEDPRQQPLPLHGDGVPVHVLPLQPGPHGSLRWEVQAGDRQAPLIVVLL